MLKLGLKSNPVYPVQNHKVFLTKSQWKRNITVQLMYALHLKTKKETETIFRSDECRAEQEYKASAHMAYCLCFLTDFNINRSNGLFRISRV